MGGWLEEERGLALLGLQAVEHTKPNKSKSYKSQRTTVEFHMVLNIIKNPHP
jgi:hypothetical protein